MGLRRDESKYLLSVSTLLAERAQAQPGLTWAGVVCGALMDIILTWVNWS